LTFNGRHCGGGDYKWKIGKATSSRLSSGNNRYIAIVQRLESNGSKMERFEFFWVKRSKMEPFARKGLTPNSSSLNFVFMIEFVYKTKFCSIVELTPNSSSLIFVRSWFVVNGATYRRIRRFSENVIWIPKV
jgi:hypothetical protein